jgi:hypothetical protein
VSAETQVKYGPQESALALLLSQAAGQRDQSVAVARSTRRGLTAASQAAAPQVAKIYQDALGALQAAQGGLPVATAGTDGPAGSIVAASQRDFADERAKLAGEQSMAAQDLVNRQLGAAAGEAGSVRAANDQFNSDVAKVKQQYLDLKGQEGAYGSSRLSELLQAASQAAHDLHIHEMSNAQSERDSLRSAGIDPDTGQPIPNGPLDPNSPRYTRRGRGSGRRLPGGAKLLTPLQHGALKDAVASTVSVVQGLKSAGYTRAEIAQSLAQGEPASTIKAGTVDPETGQKAPTDLHVPGVPKTKALVASVALDLAFDRHLSRASQQELHRRGYSVKRLGFPSYGQYLKTVPGAPGSPIAGPPAPGALR